VNAATDVNVIATANVKVNALTIAGMANDIDLMATTGNVTVESTMNTKFVAQKTFSVDANRVMLTANNAISVASASGDISVSSHTKSVHISGATSASVTGNMVFLGGDDSVLVDSSAGDVSVNASQSVSIGGMANTWVVSPGNVGVVGDNGVQVESLSDIAINANNTASVAGKQGIQVESMSGGVGVHAMGDINVTSMTGDVIVNSVAAEVALLANMSVSIDTPQQVVISGTTAVGIASSTDITMNAADKVFITGTQSAVFTSDDGSIAINADAHVDVQAIGDIKL